MPRVGARVTVALDVEFRVPSPSFATKKKSISNNETVSSGHPAHWPGRTRMGERVREFPKVART